MAATAQEILDYLTDIKYAQSVYMDKINRMERLGHTDIFKWKLRITILGYYVAVLVDYFSQDAGSAEYASNNFFTTTEAIEIMDRINSLCDSNYELDI